MMKVSERNRLAQIETQKDQIMIDFFRNSLGYNEEEIRHRLSKASTAELQGNTAGALGLLQSGVQTIGERFTAESNAAAKLANKEAKLANKQAKIAGKIPKKQAGIAAPAAPIQPEGSEGSEIPKLQNSLVSVTKFTGFSKADVRFINTVAKAFLNDIREKDLFSEHVYKAFGVDNTPLRFREAREKVQHIRDASDLFWMFNSEKLGKSFAVLPYLEKNYGINPFEFVEFLRKATTGSSPAPITSLPTGRGNKNFATRFGDARLEDISADDVNNFLREKSQGAYQFATTAAKNKLKTWLKGRKRAGGRAYSDDDIDKIFKALQTNGSHTSTGKGSIDQISDALFGGGPTAAAEKDALKTELGTAAGASTPYLTEQRAARNLADMYVPSTRPAAHDHENGTGDIHEATDYHGATPYGIVAPSSEAETPHHTEAAAAFHNFMKQGYIRPIDLSASNTPEINLHSGPGGSVGAIGQAYRQSWALPQLDPTTGRPIVDAMGEQVNKPLGPMEAPMWHSGTFGVDKDAWSFKSPREEASNLDQLLMTENPDTPGINYTPAAAAAAIQKVKETGSTSHIPPAAAATFTTNSLRQTATAHRVGFLMGNPDGKGKPIAVEWDPSAHGGAGQYVAGMGHDANNGGLLKFNTELDTSGNPQGVHGSEVSMGIEGLQHHLALMSRIMPPSALVAPDHTHPSGYRPYGVNVNDAWQRTSSGTVLPGSRNFVSDAVNVHLHGNPQGVGLGFVKASKAGGMTDAELDAKILATKGKGYQGALTDAGKTNTAAAVRDATDASSKLHVETPEVVDPSGVKIADAIPADQKVEGELANRTVGIKSVNTSSTP